VIVATRSTTESSIAEYGIGTGVEGGRRHDRGEARRGFQM
jgi:hypothetical protein